MIKEEQIATIEAEEVLLGAILLEASAGRNVTGELSLFPEVFSDYVHNGIRARMYSTMLRCELPDTLSVANELARANTINAGDCAFLYRVQSLVPCSLDYTHYAEIVRDYALKRDGKYERGNPRQGKTGGVEL
jgi:replicative DNA helicase